MDQTKNQPALAVVATPETSVERAAATLESLSLDSNKRPVTPSGHVGVIMRMKTGIGQDAETGEPFWFFEYKTRFYDPPIRIEWEAETMATALPAAVAESLIKNNYARVMNGAEVRAYNRGLGKPKEDQL